MPYPRLVISVDRQRNLYNLVQPLKYPMQQQYSCLEYLSERRALAHAYFDRLSKQARGQKPQYHGLYATISFASRYMLLIILLFWFVFKDTSNLDIEYRNK